MLISFKFYNFTSIVATPLGASALCLLLITTERYICITQPYKSKSSLDQNKKLKYVLVVCVWIVSMTIMMITPLLWMKGGTSKRFQQVCVRNVQNWTWLSIMPLPFAEKFYSGSNSSFFFITTRKTACFCEPCNIKITLTLNDLIGASVG